MKAMEEKKSLKGMDHCEKKLKFDRTKKFLPFFPRNKIIDFKFRRFGLVFLTQSGGGGRFLAKSCQIKKKRGGGGEFEKLFFSSLFLEIGQVRQGSP